jgi:hypothetical protein
MRFAYPVVSFTSSRNPTCGTTRCGIVFRRDSESQISFQMTVLSPRDRFSRPTARKILNTRLNYNPIPLQVAAGSNDESIMNQIITHLNDNCDNLRYVPRSFTSFRVTTSKEVSEDNLPSDM